MRSGAPAVASEGPPVLRTLTQTGTLVGTPAYMAPEQHLARGVDARTDQFAFCVTCFECLFGQRPFAGDTQAELTMNVVEGRLQSLPRERGDTPTEILAALQRGMSVHPADRWPALADLLAELRAIVVRHEPRDRKGLLIAAGLLLPDGGGGGVVFGGDGPGRVPGGGDGGAAAEAGARGGEAGCGAGAETKTATKKEVAAPAGLFLGKPTRTDAAAVAGLIGQVLPKELTIAGGPEGVYLTGDGAGRWKLAAEQLVGALGDDFSRRSSSPLVTQVQTPDRQWCGVFVLDGEDFAARVKAIGKLQGVTKVGQDRALGVVLALGDGKLGDEVKKLLREPKGPKFRGWYFINDSMGRPPRALRAGLQRLPDARGLREGGAHLVQEQPRALQGREVSRARARDLRFGTGWLGHVLAGMLVIGCARATTPNTAGVSAAPAMVVRGDAALQACEAQAIAVEDALERLADRYLWEEIEALVQAWGAARGWGRRRRAGRRPRRRCWWRRGASRRRGRAAEARRATTWRSGRGGRWSATSRARSRSWSTRSGGSSGRGRCGRRTSWASRRWRRSCTRRRSGTTRRRCGAGG
jgi:hypothetical protein